MDIPLLTLLLLGLAGFIAGFVEAITGGGGLIMLPSLLIGLPSHPVSNLIGTVKIPAFSGISLSAWQYSKQVKLNIRLVVLCCVVAFGASYAGSWTLTLIDNAFMKPFLLAILVLVAIYTFMKKDFAAHQPKTHSANEQMLYASLICLVVGFYNGFIGAGGGSFFLLSFVTIIGFPFLQASAYAKICSTITNLASIVLFTSADQVIWPVAIAMSAGSMLGALLGTRFAITKGSAFVRPFFLAVVSLMLLRFAYDVFKN